MKRSVLVLLAVCALLVSAIPASAVAPKPNALLGDWVFTYTGDVKDTVTITDVCGVCDSSDTGCSLTVCTQGDYWTYIANGKKSDGTHIQIRKISFADTQQMYYEGISDEELLACGQKCPNATIPDTNYLECGAFKVDDSKNKYPVTPTTLLGGKKVGTPLECDALNSCFLQKIIPAKINKLVALLQPVMPIVIIANADTPFVQGDKAVFSSTAIIPVVQPRLGSKMILAICVLRPLQLTAGDVNVNVNDCIGLITVK